MTLDNLLHLVAKQSGDESWLIDKIKGFPKNEWFVPDNKTDPDFTICTEMHHHGWCSRLSEPIWKNGSYKGSKISFYITIDATN